MRGVHLLWLVLGVILASTLLDSGEDSRLGIPNAEAITVGTFPPVHIVSKYGYVFRRGLVLTANGDPIFATFDDKGKVVREIGAATGAYQDAFVMSVPEYQVWLKRSQDGVNAGNVLMSSTEYKGATFETVDKKPVAKPALQDTTKSVLVLAPDKILTVNDAIVVEELPIDTTQVATLEASSKSLLINKDGLVVVQDVNPIGFRTAFLNDTQTNTSRDSLAAVGAGDGNLLNYPLPGVLVETSMGGVGSTDGSGRYGLFDFYPPCPGFSYDINNWVTAKFPYTTANPKAGYMAHYVPFSVQSSVACVGTTDVVFPGIIPVFTANSNIISYPRANIAVDAFMLTGTVHLANPSGDSVPADVATNYGYDSYANTRLLDQGLLTGISQDDLLKTDAYIFRESDGLMIGELRGMQLYEPSKNDPVQRAYFRQFLPGFRDTFIFHNHPPRVAGLRVGEKIRVVAINRATGYMASKMLEATPTQPNGIEIALGDMALMPPNLKFKVMREFDPFVRADLRVKVKESQIAFEGSGLSSDKKILVYSEWLDQDGKPLPETLPGYTGRITKVIQANTLANSGADVAQFEVIPNGHLQLVKFPNVETTAREHFYIHINGENKQAGNPDFSAIGAGTGALQYRPAHYVPILTQIPDIAASNAAKEEALAHNAASTYQAVYRWQYRPEAQYSIFDFDPTHLKPVDPYAQQVLPPGVQFVNLEKDMSLYTLLGGAQILLRPKATAQDPYGLGELDRFGTTTREFVFEVTDTNGVAHPVRVDQYGYVSSADLASLGTIDLLALSLFQYDDPENVLWDPVPKVYFKFPDIDPSQINEPIKPEKDVYRVLAGVRLKIEYQPLLGKTLTSVNWSIPLDYYTYLGYNSSTTVDVSQVHTKDIYVEMAASKFDTLSSANEISVPITITGNYKDADPDKQKISLVSRVLKPGVKKGSDVRMLDMMLFNLGLSPQFATYGYQGNARKDNVRNVFSSGTTTKRGTKVKGNTSESLEIMVRRFQYHDRLVDKYANPDGIVGKGTLTNLKTHWSDYLAAYDAYPSKSAIEFGDLKDTNKDDFNQWLDAAVTELQTVYTPTIHAKVSSTVKTRNILYEWAKKEASIGHSGYGGKLYRATLGGGDNLGSIGFSQIQNKYRYSTNKNCTAIQSMNLYDPRDGLKAFATWSNKSNCGVGFYNAFKSGKYDFAYITSDPHVPTDPYGAFDPYSTANPISMVIGHARENVKGDITTSNITVDTYATLPDELEELSKGIMSYNFGLGAPLTTMTWAEILKTTTIPTSATHDKSGQPTHGVWYSITARKAADISKSLLRKYLWMSRREKVDPTTKEAVDFCFEYGESDWLAGVKWQTRHDEAKNGKAGVVKTCPK